MSIISRNQAVCPLPGNGSYEVYTVWNGGLQSRSWWSNVLPSRLLDGAVQKMKRGLDLTRMEQAESVDVKFIFISFDSVCFTCDPVTQSCQRKTVRRYWVGLTD